jgi:mRNA-degrading endonuclease RelE of RelBE toxin-antitoxin system
MTTSATWSVVLAGPARKSLKRIPPPDREPIHAVFTEMAADPFQGDIKYLKGQKGRFRRRAGDWRIFFHLAPEQKHVVVTAVERRSFTTY